MIDDLVSRGVSEPYRMFTSRAEFRLKLRADNADQRLTPLGMQLGCVGLARQTAYLAKSKALTDGLNLLNQLNTTPNEAARAGIEINRDGRRRTAFELLAFPGVDIRRIAAIWPEVAALPPGIASQLETDARYRSYVDRQDEDVAVLRRDEATAIPDDFDYSVISGLTGELRQKLERQRPSSVAQAGRIEGMTPAALLLVLAHLKAASRRRTA